MKAVVARVLALLGVLLLLVANAPTPAAAAAPGQECILCVLNPTVSPALGATGNALFTVTTGAIAVNSSSSQALSVSGNASLTAMRIGIVGGVARSGNAQLSPSPTTISPVSDPFLSLPVPSSNAIQPSISVSGNARVTAAPGTYASLSVSGNGILTLQPGVYVVTQLVSLSGNGKLIGNGVTFYLTCGNTSQAQACASGQKGATLAVSGNATYQVTAPDSGAYRGVAVFADRNNASRLSLSGNGTDTWTGAIYAARGELSLSATGTTQLTAVIVVNIATISGNGSITLINPPLPALVWTTKAKMPTARNSLGVAAANGKLYAIGGNNYLLPPYQLSVNEAYDPLTDTWSTMASMPTARTDLALALASNSQIYAIGGSSGSAQISLATNEAYDPVENVWTTKASMPTPRFGAGVAAASNGRIYVVGGRADANIYNVLEIYDPSTDTWSTGSPMPTARYWLGFKAASNGKLYAMGGSTATLGWIDTVEAYDPTTDTWTTVSPMPTAVREFGLALGGNGKLYAIGGTGGPQGDAEVQEYDPTTDAWTMGTPMPVSRHGLGEDTAGNGRIYAMGGQDDNNIPQSSNEEATTE